MEQVILVDNDDNAIGTMEKMEAHQKGCLHRAFSVILYNSQGDMLLQKRSASKYHSGGLWTNACCSHPLPGENIKDATRRRLKEELGIDVPTAFRYKFIYKANLEGGLIEHELDHVFTGLFDGHPHINEHEVSDWKFVNVQWLKNDIRQNPLNYTYWFRLMIERPELQSTAA
jgi:isopentenyl-diphosphate Delta-isomerase